MTSIQEAWYGGMCGDGFTTISRADQERHNMYVKLGYDEGKEGKEEQKKYAFLSPEEKDKYIREYNSKIEQNRKDEQKRKDEQDRINEQNRINNMSFFEKVAKFFKKYFCCFC
jgi:hypothetical protein